MTDMSLLDPLPCHARQSSDSVKAKAAADAKIVLLRNRVDTLRSLADALQEISESGGTDMEMTATANALLRLAR
jgi:hypothetical protein